MPDSVKKGLIDAYREFLRPLIRILIRHGVSTSEFIEVVKAVYAEIAAAEFDLPGKRQSQSRVAILTGLTRKEVARLQATDYGRLEEDQKDVHRVARVLDGWHLDPEFTGPYGMPLEIPFESQEGISFTELVRRYSGDMSPRAMLDELLRVGAAREIDEGWLRVLTRSYIPETLAPEALERTARIVENFLNTVEINLKKDKTGSGRFERIVLSDRPLSKAQLLSFEEVLRRRGQEFLEELDDWLNDLEEPEDQKTWYTGLGLYHFIEKDEDLDLRQEEVQNTNEREEKQ